VYCIKDIVSDSFYNRKQALYKCHQKRCHSI